MKMIEKTAVSLLVALTAMTLLQDTLSCPEAICIKPKGTVVWSEGYPPGIRRFEANFSSVREDYPSGGIYNITPKIAIGHDGVIRYSKCQCKSGFFCIRKCCTFNSTMDIHTGRCMDTEIVTVNATKMRMSLRDLIKTDGRGKTPCFGTCSDGKELLITSLAGGVNFILISGELCTSQGSNPSCFNPNEFCIDYVSSRSGLAVASCRNTKNKDKKSSYDDYLKIFKKIRLATYFTSFLSLTGTFLVYSYFQELRNLHGKCLLCHIASYIGHFGIRIFRKYVNTKTDSAWICMALEFVYFYSYLAPFSWLNVISFDISMSFMNLRPRQGNSRKAEWMKFALYFLYASLTPVAAYIPCLLISLNSKGSAFTDFSISDWCYFGGYLRGAYRYVPMSVFMGLSVVLFVTTACRIYRIHASTSIIRSGQQGQREAVNESFKIYAKLLVLMGLMSWVMEPTFWAMKDWVHQNYTYYRRTLWVFISTFRYLQGVYISMFFLWNDKVINLVKKKVLKAWTSIQHCFPQPRKVKPLSRPENSSQVSQNPSCSNVTVTTEQGSREIFSENGYMVPGNQGREFDVFSGKPVEDAPSPSLEGSSCHPFTPLGDASGQVSFSTASGSHEITHL